jgi:hypothetical protein
MKHDGEVRAPVSDHTLESLLPHRDAENLSTSWSYLETVESLVIQTLRIDGVSGRIAA